jgi:YesN/AraC family two-component response regulator
MSIKVAVVEDEKHYNNALKKIIDNDSELDCVAQLYSGAESLALLKEMKPSIQVGVGLSFNPIRF